MVNKTESKNTIKVVPEMSMAEFKAWLEGFSECFKTGAPNKVQWKRIEERLNTVSVEQKITYNYTPNWWGQYNWNPNWNLIKSSAGEVPRGSITWCANSGDAVSSSVNFIAAATAVGQEEAKEFTV